MQSFPLFLMLKFGPFRIRIKLKILYNNNNKPEIDLFKSTYYLI